MITLTTPAPSAVGVAAQIVAQATTTGNLTGTLKIGNGATMTLTGSFNARTGAIAASGGGYTFAGTLSQGAITGTYTGPNGSGAFAARPSGAGSPAIDVFCGTSSGTDRFSGTPRPRTGVWDFVRSGNVLSGVSIATNPPEPGQILYATLAGQVTGTSLSLTAADPSGNIIGSASGTLTGTSAGGTYMSTDGLAMGTWSASTVSCSAPVASVTVLPATVNVLVGQTVQLTATTKDASGNVLGRVVTWTSSDPTVATVSTTGLVTGIAPGTPTITATSEGQSGRATITVPPLTFTVVSAGGYHTCGVAASSATYCWGDNTSGDLGSGTTPDSAITVAVAVAGGLTFAMVSAGNHFTCAITTNGAAYCWGDNSSGQLGNGTTTNSTTPVAVAGPLTLATVSAGLSHACGVTTGGAAYCWGLNDRGQLGNGTTTNSSAPVAVSGGITFAAVSAGGSHTCGVDPSGSAFCWGFNGHGELGDGSTTNRSMPVAVSGGISFAAVSTGGSHTCGVDRGGTAHCWGFNGYGALGDGTTTDRSTPVVVGGTLLHFATVSAGGSASHTCGVDTSGNALCWGFNGQGQLGNGTTTSSSTPMTVSGGLTFAKVNGGASQSCGVSIGGGAYCWGDNTAGELGNGTFVSSSTPVQVK